MNPSLSLSLFFSLAPSFLLLSSFSSSSSSISSSVFFLSTHRVVYCVPFSSSLPFPSHPGRVKFEGGGFEACSFQPTTSTQSTLFIAKTSFCNLLFPFFSSSECFNSLPLYSTLSLSLSLGFFLLRPSLFLRYSAVWFPLLGNRALATANLWLLRVPFRKNSFLRSLPHPVLLSSLARSDSTPRPSPPLTNRREQDLDFRLFNSLN